MTIFAIDPGPETSGYVLWDGKRVERALNDVPNERLRHEELPNDLALVGAGNVVMAIEQVACYGRPVGAMVFETVWWSGRFADWWEAVTGEPALRLTFREVAEYHCHAASRVKEPHVRQALLDRFGKPGTKKAPGPLYGVTGHAWSALALALAAEDRRLQGRAQETSCTSC
jgi:hypothetical protein